MIGCEKFGLLCTEQRGSFHDHLVYRWCCQYRDPTAEVISERIFNYVILEKYKANQFITGFQRYKDGVVSAADSVMHDV